MSRFFDQVERELVRAARATATGRRRSRFVALGLAAALVAGAAGTAAGATYLALHNSSIAPFAADSTTPEQRVEPGTSRVLALRVADPARGVPPWALRVSRSDAGLQCSTVGQERAGAFGLVGLDGVFRELPEANADACGTELIGTRVFAAKRLADVRTVIYGVAGTGVRRVTLELFGRPARTLRFTPDGAFLYVLRGYPEDAQPAVTLLRDGKTRRYTFADSPQIVPDPYGGQAWKLMSTQEGVPMKPGGKRPTLPAYSTGCVLFMTARPVPGVRSAASPTVCGRTPSRPGIPRVALYFTTKRLAGKGTRSPFGRGWNGHAPRTVAWGSALGHHTVVVRAGSIARTVKPSPSGAFLVVLPASADPAKVTVEVDGRRYGSAYGVTR